MSAENNQPDSPNSAPQVVDTLICAGWIVPVQPAKVVLIDHAIAINNGVIIAIVPRLMALQQFAPEQLFELPQQLLCPGLINAHGHCAMSLFRGLADDTPLQQWLSERLIDGHTRI